MPVLSPVYLLNARCRKGWSGLVLLLLCLLGQSTGLLAQNAKNKVEVISSDIGRLIRSTAGEEQELVGNVVLRQEGTYIFCDSAHILKNQVQAFGNVSIVQHDSLRIFSNRLRYNGDERKAVLNGNVVLDNNGKQLFTEALDYDLQGKIATYFSGATLRDGQTQLKSRRGIYYVEQSDAFFKGKVEVTDPEFSLRSDTLQFNTRTGLTTFLAPTRIAFQSGKDLYTEAGTYDTRSRQAIFTRNPQYRSPTERAKARIIRYDDQAGTIRLEGDAYYDGEARYAKADTIQYNRSTGLIDLVGRGKFRQENLNAAGDKLQYNTQTKSFKTFARTRIVDGATTMEAERFDYKNETGLGYAQGNVYYSDTLANYTLRCEEAEYDKSRGYMKAYGRRPVFAYKIDRDSMYVAADTFVTIRIPRNAPDSLSSDSTRLSSMDSSAVKPLQDKKRARKKDAPLKKPKEQAPAKKQEGEEPRMMELPEAADSGKIFTDSTALEDVFRSDSSTQRRDSITRFFAYHKVLVYKSDMQAVCDSLSFEGSDSTFSLFRDPVIWSDSTQLLGDTIRMRLKDKKPERLILQDNSLILTTTDELYFNQIRGKLTTAFFDSSAINYMLVDGNAETVYYGLDNTKAYTGVNQAACSNMKIEFDKGQVKNIRFYTNPSGTYSPMGKTDHEKIKLKGFRWRSDERPKSKEQLLNPWLFYIPPPTNTPVKKEEAPKTQPAKKKKRLWKN